MILAVDLRPGEVTVALRGPCARQPVTVTASGCLERRRLDAAMVAAGAGCVPGHHAEVRVAWLEQALGPGAPGRWPAGRLDGGGEWLSAAITWIESGPTGPAAGADGPSTPAGGSTWTEMEAQDSLLLQVTIAQPEETSAVLRSFKSG